MTTKLPFKLGFCFSWNEDIPKRLEGLAQLGYDGVEFWDQFLVQQDVDQLADQCAQAGIKAAQLCPYFNFVDGQEAWDNSMRLAEKYIAWSVRFPGTPLLRVFTGVPWGDRTVGVAKATPAQWDAAIRGLQAVCDMAAPHGVRFALECHTGSLMEDSPSTTRLLQGVNRPNLGVNLQLPLGAGGQEDVYDSIAALGEHTCHMHSHNYKSLPMNGMEFLGEGVLDYRQILRRLVAKGFDGHVSIEHPDHLSGIDPWHTAQVEAKYLLQLREELAAEMSA